MSLSSPEEELEEIIYNDGDEYSPEQMERMNELSEDVDDLRDTVIDELERSSGGKKDIQLLSLLRDGEYGGDIEEDCDVGDQHYRV